MSRAARHWRPGLDKTGTHAPDISIHLPISVVRDTGRYAHLDLFLQLSADFFDKPFKKPGTRDWFFKD